jgi:hypothetical protein
MQGISAIWMGGQDLSVKRGGMLQLPGLMQAHCLDEHAANIKTRQCHAFLGLPLRTRDVRERYRGGSIVRADRLAWIDFGSSRAKNISYSASVAHLVLEGKTEQQTEQPKLGGLHE